MSAIRVIDCPVCGLETLTRPPFERWPRPPELALIPPYEDQLGSPSYEECSVCLFEFGADNNPGTAAGDSFDDYRTHWMAQRQLAPAQSEPIGFGEFFRSARQQAGLTQADVAATTGIARPNIAAYESGRREPRISTADKLIASVEATLTMQTPVTWDWTSSIRPYAVPSRTWRLTPSQALATITSEAHPWWSGPPRTFDLSIRQERLRAYEIILREGAPADIEAVVDEVLLAEAWRDLVLPSELRDAWQPLLDDPERRPGQSHLAA